MKHEKFATYREARKSLPMGCTKMRLRRDHSPLVEGRFRAPRGHSVREFLILGVPVTATYGGPWEYWVEKIV